MAIGELARFEDLFCIIDPVWVFLHLEKELSRGGRAVDERHLDGLEAQQVVAVDMAEEECCGFWFVRVISEVVDSDTGELLDDAIEGRHDGGTMTGATVQAFSDGFSCKAEMASVGLTLERGVT